LFRTQKVDAVKTNLMVFIRPKILRNSLDTSIETNQKYNKIREIQQQSSSFGLLKPDERPELPPLESYDRPDSADAEPQPDANE